MTVQLKTFYVSGFKQRHYTYFSNPSFVRYILYFVLSQASSTGRHGSTDCTVPGAASLADYKVKYISHNQKINPKFVVST